MQDFYCRLADKGKRLQTRATFIKMKKYPGAPCRGMASFQGNIHHFATFEPRFLENPHSSTWGTTPVLSPSFKNGAVTLRYPF
jgi:hypothetical protein